MITFVIFIALFTVIYGRLFCGWVCPQTIFMEMIFRPIEWLIEGNPAEQKQLNNGKWSFKKFGKKSLKHLIFLFISFVIANTFLAYIFLAFLNSIKLLKSQFQIMLLCFWCNCFYVIILSGFCFCKRNRLYHYFLPYGRLQGVLFDRDTMLVAYDYKRGEERGKFKKNVERTSGELIVTNV